MNNVNIQYSTNGLGTPATGQDFISGMVFYGAPSGLTVQCLSVADLENAGIIVSTTGSGTSETLAIATSTVTTNANLSDPYLIEINKGSGWTTIGSGTFSGSSNVNSDGTQLRGAINANTSTGLNTGLVATGTGGTVSITAPTGSGAGANSWQVRVTVTTSGAYAMTSNPFNFSGGVNAVPGGINYGYNDVIHYHVAEYFRGNATGNLYVQMVTSGSSASNYNEITNLQLSTGGILRQVGIYEQISYTGLSTNMAYLQTQVNSVTTNNMPLEVVYQCNFSGLTNLNNLADLSTSLYPNVSVLVGQDGAALGNTIFNSIGKSVGIMGIVLGRVSAANVANSIAWVANNNVSNVELATPAFANGTLYNTLTSNAVSTIDAKQYIFLRTFVGISGTYFNNDYTANVVTSPYSSIHLNRVIHKAARSVRTALLPALASPVYFNTDGTIAVNSVVYFKSLAAQALANMQTNSEISQYAVIINVKQNVLATKVLNMTLQIIPVGVANTINVNLGFVLTLPGN